MVIGIDIKKGRTLGTCLVSQWLRLFTPNAEGIVHEFNLWSAGMQPGTAKKKEKN